MRKIIVLALLLVSFLIVDTSTTYGRKDDPKEREEESYELKKELKKSIKKGQTTVDILAIMGEPELTETLTDKSGVVEIWYYDDHEVRIEFKNGLVSKWFLRFMPDKEVKQKDSKDKCDLCEKDKKPKQK
jgi:hypothetical protein